MFDINKHRDEQLRMSRFGHVFERGALACAYHSIRMLTVYFPRKYAAFFSASATFTVATILQSVDAHERPALERMLTELCSGAIVVPVNYDETQYLAQVRNLLFQGPKIRVMVVHLTDYCNLDCGYCFIEGGLPARYERVHMSEVTMRATIDHFVRITVRRTFPKRPSIVFYGGEPLANWRVMLYGLEYLRTIEKERGLEPYDKIVITNGTLLSRKKAKALKAHGVMVSLSIDGPASIHDANRVTCAGKGSFEKVMRGYDALREVGIKPTVSCVLSKESIGHEREIIRFLVDDLHIDALGFNHVSIIPNVHAYDPVYEQQYAQAILNVQDVIQEEYPHVYERRMNSKINNFVDQNLMRADCTGCGEQISVSARGEIGVCQGYMGNRSTFNNSVFNKTFDPNTDAVFVEWSSRSPLSMEGCYDCVALATCGGGCPRNADVLHGSIWKQDTPFCHFAQKAQEWMIWKKYDALQEQM